VILGRLGAYFQYIRCEDAEDSPVWDLDEGDWQRHPVPIHASLLDWLDYWYEECEMAIATGYFDWSPDGTDP
jgi:hypothetical protein